MSVIGSVIGFAALVLAALFLWSTAGAMITSQSTVGVLLGVLLVAAMLGGLYLIGRHIWRAVSHHL